MAVLWFLSHGILNETNHFSNGNSPFLTLHLQSDQAACFLLSPSFLIPPLLAFICPPSRFSSFHLWLYCQPSSDTPGFPFHLVVRDGMTDGERQEKSGGMQWSVLMNAVREKVLMRWKKSLKEEIRWIHQSHQPQITCQCSMVNDGNTN